MAVASSAIPVSWRNHNFCGARSGAQDSRFSGDNAFPDRSFKDFSSQSVGPAIAAAGPGNIMVVMRETKTGLPLSMLHPVTVRPGYVHVINLYPASRDQFADLPK